MITLEQLRDKYKPYLKSEGKVSKQVQNDFKKDIERFKLYKMDMEETILEENNKN